MIELEAKDLIPGRLYKISSRLTLVPGTRLVR